MMKIKLFLFLATGLFMGSVVLANRSSRPEPVPAGFAVVELFTSQGCSSCPAAEEVLSRLVLSGQPNVYALAFHVDYWDNLGWKDQFSSAQYTARQHLYAAGKGADGVYTPQAIVNGEVHLIGSEEQKLRKVIDRVENKTAENQIALKAGANSNSSVELQYDVSGETKDVVLNVALVQRLSKTAVKSGENAGRSLGIMNVVRSFKTIPAGKGSIPFALPKGLEAKDCAVIFYTQNKQSMHITGANEYKFDL